jgi:hypothetical protein
MTTTAAIEEVVTIRSSRIWALFTLRFTALIFPMRMLGDSHGISTITVTRWFTPWVREEEHLPIGQVAEFKHGLGLIWDTISVESTGGINPLAIEGLRKSRAADFIRRVRGRMGVKG